MAEVMGARLTLFTVALPVDADVSVIVPPVVGALAFSTPVPGPGGPGMSPEALERVAHTFRGRGLDVRATVVADEQPARAIAAHAAAHDVDLIAMTTHGRGAFGRLVAGGVSERAPRTAPKPLLLDRPALERAFASGKPALVNVLTDPSVVYPRRANLA
jgi:nucleotide-binding universal stress UspA family protein